MKKAIQMTLPDGSKWNVPVDVVARNRAAHYAHEFEGDIERSLKEDTEPLFEGDAFSIIDWATNNMNWSDVAAVAYKVADADMDMDECWINGDKEIVLVE